MINLTKTVSVSFRRPYLLTDGYTLVSVSSTSGNWSANRLLPTGGLDNRKRDQEDET